jgi:hypothetical protein
LPPHGRGMPIVLHSFSKQKSRQKNAPKGKSGYIAIAVLLTIIAIAALQIMSARDDATVEVAETSAVIPADAHPSPEDFARVSKPHQGPSPALVHLKTAAADHAFEIFKNQMSLQIQPLFNLYTFSIDQFQEQKMSFNSTSQFGSEVMTVIVSGESRPIDLISRVR